MDVPRTGSRSEPAINIPSALLAWIAILAIIHASRSFLSSEADIRLLLETAFFPAQWSMAAGYAGPEDVVAAVERAGALSDTNVRLALARYLAQAPLRAWSAVSYSLLHGSWTHLGLSCLVLATFGTVVVRRCGTAGSLALWLAAAAGGAAAQWLSAPLGVDVMIGSSASVSGFMAAAATFVFARPGEGRWGFLANRSALALLALWVGVNLLTGLLSGPGSSEGDIAWASHIGGLLVGLALFPFLHPAPGRPRPRP